MSNLENLSEVLVERAGVGLVLLLYPFLFVTGLVGLLYDISWSYLLVSF